jgi:hypothetical protein
MYTQNISTINHPQGVINAIRTAEADYKKGFAERMVGYYDKWYRRCRQDEGKAYDRGVMAAAKDPGCKPECVIIECDTF